MTLTNLNAAGAITRLQWEDPATGFACLAKLNPHLGIWCGYVAVPAGHPWFGQGYDDVPDVDVHGGLTYAAPCDDDPLEGICHFTPGSAERAWWLGFDCGHFMDIAPEMDRRMAEQGIHRPEGDWGATFKDLDYVRDECASLAAQVASAAIGG